MFVFFLRGKDPLVYVYISSPQPCFIKVIKNYKKVINYFRSLIYIYAYICMIGFPDGSAVKTHALQHRRCKFDPWGWEDPEW